MHGNPVLREVQRQRLRQPHAAKLRRAIAGVMLAAHFAGFRVDLDDATFNAVADHQAGKLAGAEEVAHQIHLQRTVEIPQREVADKRRFSDPGAIDQQVDAGKYFVYPAGEGDHAGFAGGVRAEAPRRAFAMFCIDGLRDAGRFIALNIDHRHAIAFCGKPATQKLP